MPNLSLLVQQVCVIAFLVYKSNTGGDSNKQILCKNTIRPPARCQIKKTKKTLAVFGEYTIRPSLEHLCWGDVEEEEAMALTLWARECVMSSFYCGELFWLCGPCASPSYPSNKLFIPSLSHLRLPPLLLLTPTPLSLPSPSSSSSPSISHLQHLYFILLIFFSLCLLPVSLLLREGEWDI